MLFLGGELGASWGPRGRIGPIGERPTRLTASHSCHFVPLLGSTCLRARTRGRGVE